MSGLKDHYEELEALESCADRVRTAGLPVYIYGMGSGGEKMLGWCRDNGIAVTGVFASDDFVRGQSFCGYKVKSLAQAEKESGELTVLLGFGTDLPDVMSRIESIEKRHLLLAPDVSVAGDRAFDKQTFLDDLHRAAKAYDLLADEQSRRVFLKLSEYKISGRLSYLREIFSNDKDSLVKTGDNEVYCDLGAYNGDTVRSFIKAAGGRYEHIYALEPEKRNFQKCVKSCLSFDRISFINAAAWSCDTQLSFEGGSGRQARLDESGSGKTAARSLDSVLAGSGCTYIKYDVEGADIPALEGSKKTIKGFTPKLRCAVYHRCYDYIDIPLYINSLGCGYRFYMRQDRYYPAWETEIIAVSGEDT